MRRKLYALSLLSGAVLLAVLPLLSAPTAPAQAQAGCTTYNQCPKLQQVSGTKRQSPITYWFDNDFIFPNDSEAADDVRAKVAAAAAAWATRVGIGIQRVSSGGHVRVRISGVSLYRAVNGDVRGETGGLVMTFSNEWTEWNEEGRNWIASHEWGHVIGFADVAASECTGVVTVMRQGSSDNEEFDNQLKGQSALPGPASPNACDICAAKDKQSGQPLGTSCAPTPTPTPEPPPPFCEPRPAGNPDPPGWCPDSLDLCNAAYEVWDNVWCRCVCAELSPVLVDVEGDGFALTDAAGGVLFDLDGDGAAERLSWTRAGADDAWLALDRDGDGVLGNGRELFGNFTPQPDPPAGEGRNGFLALAVYDRPAQGGNGDGLIDARDAVFADLRLWRDADHDGVSQPAELSALPALGLESVELNYRESKRVDEHGNRFRYRAKVRDARGAKVNRWAWDVFLVGAP